MRLSTVLGDPGFCEQPNRGDVTIMFNGEPQSMDRTGRAVITADEEAGMIVYHKSPECCLMGLETEGKGRDMRFATFTEYGRVQIIRTARLLPRF